MGASSEQHASCSVAMTHSGHIIQAGTRWISRIIALIILTVVAFAIYAVACHLCSKLLIPIFTLLEQLPRFPLEKEICGLSI
jgi:hypothetical protein